MLRVGPAVLAYMTLTPYPRRATRSGFPASAALLPRTVKLFWPSVRTEYPRLSQNRRNSFSSAVWTMRQPVWSKSYGTLDHEEPSCWVLNQGGPLAGASPRTGEPGQPGGPLSDSRRALLRKRLPPVYRGVPPPSNEQQSAKWRSTIVAS